MSIDLIFPVAYGLLFALLLLRVFDRGRPFYLLPIAGAAADVFENLSIALLASTYDGAPTSWARVAAAFTLLKSGLLLATLAAALGAAIRWLYRWFDDPHRELRGHRKPASGSSSTTRTRRHHPYSAVHRQGAPNPQSSARHDGPASTANETADVY